MTKKYLKHTPIRIYNTEMRVCFDTSLVVYPGVFLPPWTKRTHIKWRTKKFIQYLKTFKSVKNTDIRYKLKGPLEL